MPKMHSGYSKRSHHRSLLTETLPYELPLFFTNARLYKYATGQEKASVLAKKIMDIAGETIPCKFPILKKPEGTRDLSIMHPAAQFRVSEFYESYDEFIAQLCKRSEISLRYPLRAASRYFDSRYVDTSTEEGVEGDDVSFDSQSNHSSSYFAYRKYSQIYKFYDSREFLDLEQKYRFMLRIDISRCFSSIYTHSLSWAVRGKLFGKKMKSRKGASYFEDDFDKLMREANWGETSGLLIGPEVSRIFCEIILQGVDVKVADGLGDGVCVRRYMDDYFIFGRDEASCRVAEGLISDQLSIYNLFLNQSKRVLTERPLVTSLSVARHQVNIYCSQLVSQFDKRLRSSLVSSDGKDDDLAIAQPIEAEPIDVSDASHAAEMETAEAVVRHIRAICRQYSVEYSGLVAPALAVIARKLNRICSRISSGQMKIGQDSTYRLQSDITIILRVCEFLYVSDVRSSTSNKISRVFLELAEICKKLNLGRSFVELQMLDTVRKALSVWQGASLLDVINSAIAVQVITTGGRGLVKEDVENILSRKADDGPGGFSYLRVVAGLFLCSDRTPLARLRKGIIEEIEPKLCNVSTRELRDASFAMLLLDYLACPYVPVESRITVYRKVAVRLLGSKEPDLGAAKGALRSIEKSLRFTDWDVGHGSLAGLRSLLKKTELRLAYD